MLVFRRVSVDRLAGHALTDFCWTTRWRYRARVNPMLRADSDKHVALYLCAVLTLCSGSLGQAVPRTGVLKILSSVTTNEVASSLVLPAKCDMTGNAWVRVASDKVGAGPILKIP